MAFGQPFIEPVLPVATGIEPVRVLIDQDLDAVAVLLPQ